MNNRRITPGSVSFYRTDMWLLYNAWWQDPAAYGFRVPPPGSETFGSDIYCDGTHKTTSAHRHAAVHLYRSLTPPLRIDSVGRTADGGLTLDWSGGSPPFRLERTTDLSSGRWEPVGEVSISVLRTQWNQPSLRACLFVVLGLSGVGPGLSGVGPVVRGRTWASFSE